jgi:hypothetical protein
MFRSFGIETCSRHYRLAHVLIGEPVPTSPEHALAKARLSFRSPGRLPGLLAVQPTPSAIRRKGVLTETSDYRAMQGP